MAALTADVEIPHLGTPTKISVPCVKADTFFKGALVYLDISNNTGLCQVDSVAAGDVFVGICAAQTITTAASDLVPIYIDGCWAFAATGVAATDVGSYVYADSSGGPTDNEADLLLTANTAAAADDMLVGRTFAINATDTTRIWTILEPLKAWDATAGTISWNHSI